MALDTNIVEQTLIIPIRYLAGSFGYKTQNGAGVGDRHMSLVARRPWFHTSMAVTGLAPRDPGLLATMFTA